MYYIQIKDSKIIGKGQCKLLNSDILNIEVSEDIYNNIEKYIYKDNELVLNPDYEKELAKKERERLDKLSLTSSDVERAIYQAKGIDFEDILDIVKDNPEIDSKGLKIELKANNFYRGNPYINKIGLILGFSENQLDEFFKTNDYTKLMTPAEEDTSKATDKGAENAPPDIIKNTESTIEDGVKKDNDMV